MDGFVGVKSHRAKGKRLTTYDVATLAFVEPERPERPELPGRMLRMVRRGISTCPKR